MAGGDALVGGAGAARPQRPLLTALGDQGGAHDHSNRGRAYSANSDASISGSGRARCADHYSAESATRGGNTNQPTTG